MRVHSLLGAAFAAIMLLAAPVSAQQQTAAEFLHAIYDPYKSDSAPPLDAAAMARYFTLDVAALIAEDSAAAATKGDIPKLAGDPFIDAQDWKIDALNIAVAETGPGGAVGTVTFQNFGEPFEIKLDLVKTREGWRIAEIYAPSGKLTTILAK